LINLLQQLVRVKLPYHFFGDLAELPLNTQRKTGIIDTTLLYFLKPFEDIVLLESGHDFFIQNFGCSASFET
jgi:hypothetical protein